MSDALTPGGPLRIESRSEGDARVLRITGELAESDCGDFAARLEREIGPGAARVILDLEALSYISSSGLNTLVAVHQALAKSGCRLILAGANRKIRKLLNLNPTARLIETADGAAEALARP